MRRLRFLVPADSFRDGPGAQIKLPYEEARHVRITLRGTPGLLINLFDGEGKEYCAQILSLSATEVQAVLVEEESNPVEAPLRIVALQAVSQDESFEAAVDQMTALGVSAIVPLLVERSRMGMRRPDARRLMRWQRIARETCKQCWRRAVPRIEEPIPVSEVPAVAPPHSLGFLFEHEARDGTLRACLARPAPQAVFVAIGPEGGFSPEEHGALVGAGFEPMRLGPRVLRTGNAGAAAIAVMLAAWGDVG